MQQKEEPQEPELHEVREGRRLNLVIHEPPQSKDNQGTIFFIHGLGGRAEHFENQLNYFQKTNRVVGIDLLGFGYSEKPRNWVSYRYQEHVQDVLAAFDQYKGKVNTIVGHSMGTLVASFVAIELHKQNRLDLLHNLILIGAVVEVRFSKWTRRFLSIVPDFVMKGMQRAFGNRISRSMWSKHTDKNLIAEELRKISRINSIYAIKAFVCQMESPTASDWEPLKNSHLRTLLLVGDEDQATPLKDSTKLSEWLPNCEVFVVEKAGHMPMIEQPQIVNQKIEEFITRKN